MRGAPGDGVPGDGLSGEGVTTTSAVHRQNDGKKLTRIERVYRFQFGIDARTMAKFARVQSLAAIRAGGNVDLSALFEVLCDTYLERYDAATRANRRAAKRADRKSKGEKRKTQQYGGKKDPKSNGNKRKEGGFTEANEIGGVGENREDRESAGGDKCGDMKRARGDGAGVPPAVRDRVIHRDGGRCTFVDRNGQRCTETIALQVDHVKPAALGGTGTESNLRAMCPAHNRLLAERTFGRDTVKRAIETSRPRSREPG